MSEQKHTSCPSCGIEIDVNELLYHQLEKRAQQKYQSILAEQQSSLREQQQEIAKQQGELHQTISQQVADALTVEKKKLTQ